MNKALFNELEKIGRIQLSDHFFMREFLYSEIAITNNISNLSDNLATAVESGTYLCEQILEPMQKAWGRLHIRSGYRSSAVNDFGNKNKMNCASNTSNFGAHIWDVPDRNGFIGASACVVIPRFLRYFKQTGDWASNEDEKLRLWVVPFDISAGTPDEERFKWPKASCLNGEGMA